MGAVKAIGIRATLRVAEGQDAALPIFYVWIYKVAGGECIVMNENS